MVLSYYMTRWPYAIAWKTVHLFRRRPRVVFHCENEFDVFLFRNVQKHLPPIPIVAKKKKVRDNLQAMNYTAKRSPYFPDAVIMFRNSAWKFPVKQITKIGFTHGAYSFKRYPKAYYYNMFDVFLMTSDADVERIKKHGVTTAKAVGYPKTDSFLDGSITPDSLKQLAARLGLDDAKKTVLFSATWDGSGMSAIDRWFDRLDTLTPAYNILVTVHSWMSEHFVQVLKKNEHIHFIQDMDILKYLMLADICISDTTSLIAEFCLLDKPIITFRVPPTPRTMPDVMQMIESVSDRIDTFEELAPAIQRALDSPNERQEQRQQAARTIVYPFDGKAGLRAAQDIFKLLPWLKSDHD